MYKAYSMTTKNTNADKIYNIHSADKSKYSTPCLKKCTSTNFWRNLKQAGDA